MHLHGECREGRSPDDQRSADHPAVGRRPAALCRSVVVPAAAGASDKNEPFRHTVSSLFNHVTGSFRLEVLETQQERTRFKCGVAALGSYFPTLAPQDARCRTSACFVAVQDETNAVTGYYTLAAGSVPPPLPCSRGGGAWGCAGGCRAGAPAASA